MTRQHHNGPHAEQLTISQQFIRDIGYQGSVPTEEAICWHYHALKRRIAFQRHENLGVPGGGFGDDEILEKEDHERVMAELGITHLPFIEETLKHPIPEDVSALLWDWAL
jgi:hypothetical protein